MKFSGKDSIQVYQMVQASQIMQVSDLRIEWVVIQIEIEIGEVENVY